MLQTDCTRHSTYPSLTFYRRSLYHFATRQDLSPKNVRVRDGRRGQVGVGAFAQLDYFLFAGHSDGARLTPVLRSDEASLLAAATRAAAIRIQRA
jgi:hypothetical protein